MAGKQPMLSFARVVSGTINSLDSNDNISTDLHLNSTINGIINNDQSNISAKSNADKMKSLKGNRKDKKGNNSSSRSSRSCRASKVARENRLSNASVDVEQCVNENENNTNTAAVVLEPAPLPTVNAWFKSKGIN